VEVYDRRRFYGLIGRYKNWALERALSKALAALGPKSVVLDMPCGTGRIDNWLLRSELRVVAADVSLEMLQHARRQIDPTPLWLGLVRADATALPLRSGSIDAVVSIRFFHLLERSLQTVVLRELARVAKGWLVVEYQCDFPAKAVKRALLRLVGRIDPPKLRRRELWEEFARCGLLVDHARSRASWWSGSTLVVAAVPPAGGNRGRGGAIARV
jgi:ubiquinone/menaquinone biosynthesis C-methylase UbiE